MNEWLTPCSSATGAERTPVWVCSHVCVWIPPTREQRGGHLIFSVLPTVLSIWATRSSIGGGTAFYCSHPVSWVLVPFPTPGRGQLSLWCRLCISPPVGRGGGSGWVGVHWGLAVSALDLVTRGVWADSCQADRRGQSMESIYSLLPFEAPCR